MIFIIIIFIFCINYMIISKINKDLNKIDFVDYMIKSLENNNFDETLSEILKKLKTNKDKRLKYIQKFKQHRDLFVNSIIENLDECKQYLKLIDELQIKNNILYNYNKRLNKLNIKIDLILKENNLKVYDIMKNKKDILEKNIIQLNEEINIINVNIQNIIKKLNIEEIEKLRIKQNEYFKQMGKLANNTGLHLENIVKQLIETEINNSSLKIIQNVKFHDKNKNLFAEFDLMVIKLDENESNNKPVKCLKVIEVKHNANNITESFYHHKKQLEIISDSDEMINGYVNNQVYKFSKKSFENFEITKYLYFMVGYPDDFIVFPYPYSSKIINYIISKFTTIPTIKEVYEQLLNNKKENNQKVILTQDFDINKLIEVKNFEKLDDVSKQIINSLLDLLIIDTNLKLKDVLELYKNNGYSDHIIKINIK